MKPDFHGPTATPPLSPDQGPTGIWRIGMLRPLRIRDFAFLWTGLTISLVGDGLFLVAIAWQVFDLSESPVALSAVTFAWSLPMVVFLLVGGAISDRFDRRYVMIAADLIRAGAIAAMGALVVTGIVEIWHLVVLAAVYGVGQAFFPPAFGAIVPDIVPPDQLVQANALDNFVRPFGEKLAGPALGGLLVAAVGAGPAFLLDAGSFLFSAVMIFSMRPHRRFVEERRRRVTQDIAEGFRFVRSQTWLWATLLSASLTLLFVFGPYHILLPYLIRTIGGSAADLGFVFAAGGLGSIIGAFYMGQRNLPRKHILFMYTGWGIGVSTMFFYAFVTKPWQSAILEGVSYVLFTAGMIVWTTMMHRLVPARLLGRVTSVDWMVSTALTPISFALSGPIAVAIGLDTTFILSGLLGGLATFAFLLVPGIRDTERDGSLDAPVPIAAS
jgi:hypothetical protein